MLRLTGRGGKHVRQPHECSNRCFCFFAPTNQRESSRQVNAVLLATQWQAKKHHRPSFNRYSFHLTYFLFLSSCLLSRRAWVGLRKLVHSRKEVFDKLIYFCPVIILSILANALALPSHRSFCLHTLSNFFRNHG